MIGYYVHHHGVGHMTRSASITAALDEPVTVLSSRRPPLDHPAADWVELPLDVPVPRRDGHEASANAETGHDETGYDETAGGAVHWAPTGVDGLTSRMAAIAGWVVRAQPTAVVVDVSVEVAVFVRLMGIPVVVMAMPGDRTDDPHALAYRMATRIVAPWSRDVYDPTYLHPYADKTTHVGSISRFDGRTAAPTDTASNPPTVLVLGGAGGSAVGADDIAAADAASPGYGWRYAGAGAGTWVDDVWPLLVSAAVVVTHAGQNAIADVACSGVPAVVIPQERPFGEQQSTADALSRNEIAVAVPRWPAAHDWPRLLDAATAIDPVGWRRLRVHGAARRAAVVIEEASRP